MKIHEYQAKELFTRVGIPVPPGEIATSPHQAMVIAQGMGGPVMVKAQVHVGGRGKAGGIKYAENAEAAKVQATSILDMSIKGLPVRKVLVTQAAEILSEAYVSIILDRTTKRPVVIASSAGGVDIEETAVKSPNLIHKFPVDPVHGLRAYQARDIAMKLYKDSTHVRQAGDILMRLYHLFWQIDASLVEINPLIVDQHGRVVALDAKVNVDDNALYRQPEIEAMRDPDSEDASEVEAREGGLSFVKLDGTIGCMVNGAGLAMATMDLVKRYGAEPANFLDIGGSSNPQKVVTAMRIILREPKVKAILVNIFGGITRCDDVARGLIQAIHELNPLVPIVIRLTGTNEKEAAKLLASANLPSATTLDAVVQKAIELSGAAHEQPVGGR